MNKTAIMIVLDKSDSMANAQSATIEGFNTFLDEQKKDPTPATLSLVQFDTTYYINYIDRPLEEVERLTLDTYRPSGMTALLDAVGRGINELGARLRQTPEDQRPDKVIFVIITDGAENSSKEFSHGLIRSMIQEQSEKYSWNFVFMGANINAYEAGANLGIRKDNVAQYSTARGADVLDAYSGMSRGILRSRSASADELQSQGVLSAEDKARIEVNPLKPRRR